MTSVDSVKISSRGGEEGLTTADLVQAGRRREVWRSVELMIFFHALQIPLFLVAAGYWQAAGDLEPLVSARLFLLVDGACILTRLFVSYRAWGLLRSRRVALHWLRLSKAGVIMVFFGALLDLWGDVRLWKIADDPSDRPVLPLLTLRQAFCLDDLDSSGWPWYSTAIWISSGLGLLIVLGLVMRRDSPARAYRSGTARAATKPEAPARDQVVICCSGGGIRAAAFCMGGLQELQKDDRIYQNASAVVGVSGGGYTAAAHHIVRWNIDDSKDEVEGGFDLKGTAPYSACSPELHWLRRHTRYILESLGAVTHATLSLLFGIAVNVLLLAVAIGSTAWLLGWLFVASGRLQGWTRGDLKSGIGGAWESHWALVTYAVWIPVAGVAVFVIEKFSDRFGTMRVKWRKRLRRLTQFLIGVGGTFAVLVLGVPWLVEQLITYAIHNDTALAALLHQIGLVPNDVCTAMVQPACGASTVGTPSPGKATSVSLIAIVSSILAVLASAKSATATTLAKGNLVGDFLRKVWTKIKDPLVPYAAVTVIAVVAVIFFLRQVVLIVTDPEVMADWQTPLIIIVLLLIARALTDPNRTSLHHFFRERISEAFFVRRVDDDRVESVDYKKPLRFSKADPKGNGPKLVACAVANVTDGDLVPATRGCTPFVFDHQLMGMTDRLLPKEAAQRDSAAYEFAADEFYRDATIPAVVAMSAAAFSPLAGRENVRLGPYRAVLALANARLGVWLPNPLWMDEAGLLKRLLKLERDDEVTKIWNRLSACERRYLQETSKDIKRLVREDGGLDADKYRSKCLSVRKLFERVRSVFKKPGMFALIREAVGEASVYDRFLYVTDGGHYDNLGLIEALRRKPDTIYVLDASNDPEDTFRALGRAVATARMDLGCDVELDPRKMRRLKDKRAGLAWCQGEYYYDGGAHTGTIYVAKAIMLGDKTVPWDIETFAADNTDFPRTSTGRQQYSEFDFEAYRALGSYAVGAMLSWIRTPQTTGSRFLPPS